MIDAANIVQQVLWSDIDTIDLHGGGFTGSVSTKEGGHMTLVEWQAQVVNGQLTVLILFRQMVDGDANRQIQILRVCKIWKKNFPTVLLLIRQHAAGLHRINQKYEKSFTARRI